MGSLVGLTEERTRQALRIADAMAPCIVFVDEIEKGLSGVQASGQTDSGVSARMFGTLLSYLNDHESDVYFVCSANDVSKLPPEFTRAERIRRDLLPRPARVTGEGASSGGCTSRSSGSIPPSSRPSDRDFTGAEIRACCRLAALLDVPLTEAATNIVPVAVTAGESVERLRNWAAGRCLSADRPGIYLARGQDCDGASPDARSTVAMLRSTDHFLISSSNTRIRIMSTWYSICGWIRVRQVRGRRGYRQTARGSLWPRFRDRRLGRRIRPA